MIDAGIGANSALDTGYNIDNSVKLEADNTEYFSRTPSSDGNRQNFTFSTWVKRTELGQNSRLLHAHQDGQNFFTLGFDTSDRLVLYNINSSVDYGGHYSQRFRDTSAWYHIVFRSETTSGTATTRWKIYVNGVEITDKDTDYGTPPRWYQGNVNRAIDHRIGYNTDGSNGSSQYMAETHLVDGTPLLPTSFGEFDEDSGIWKPIEVSGLTYGTNGFYLDYTDGSDLGADKVAGGNSNDWTENNLSAADQATDTPTNNFCTLNILQNYDSIVFTEGATSASTASGGNVKDHAEANMGFSSGKWYMEFYVTNSSTSDDAMFGFGRPGLHSGKGQNSPGNDTYSFGAHNVSRWYYNNQTWTNTGASGWDKGQVIQIAIDADNGKAWQGVNGTYSSGNPSTNTGGFDWGSLVTNVAVGDLLIPVTRTMYTGPGLTAYNFGGYTALAMSSIVSDENGYGSFEYAPPTGFYALCTKNLAEYG